MLFKERLRGRSEGGVCWLKEERACVCVGGYEKPGTEFCAYIVWWWKEGEEKAETERRMWRGGEKEMVG